MLHPSEAQRMSDGLRNRRVQVRILSGGRAAGIWTPVVRVGSRRRQPSVAQRMSLRLLIGRMRVRILPGGRVDERGI